MPDPTLADLIAELRRNLSSASFCQATARDALARSAGHLASADGLAVQLGEQRPVIEPVGPVPMTVFTKGDRIRAISHPVSRGMIGKVGTVSEVYKDGSGNAIVEWDGLGKSYMRPEQCELIIAEPAPLMIPTCQQAGPSMRLTCGDRVRVRPDKPFAGRKGRVEGIDDLGYVAVVLDGGLTSGAIIVFPPAQLEPDDEPAPITEDPALLERLFLPPLEAVEADAAHPAPAMPPHDVEGIDAMPPDDAADQARLARVFKGAAKATSRSGLHGVAGGAQSDRFEEWEGA